MVQLKVRFTIEHSKEACSFTSLSELNQQSYSDLLWNRLSDFDNRLKRAAADVWLRQKLGAEHHSSVQILIAQEERIARRNDSTTKA
jgi:hypothetical protein